MYIPQKRPLPLNFHLKPTSSRFCHTEKRQECKRSKWKRDTADMMENMKLMKYNLISWIVCLKIGC